MATTIIPQYQLDLEARIKRNDLKADLAKRGMTQKLEYLKENGTSMLADEAVDKVSESNPLIGKILNRFVGSKSAQKEPESSRGQQRSTTSIQDGRTSLFGSNLTDRFARLGSFALPFLYTIGQRKMLSYGLKGAGYLVRAGARALFGSRRRKRRRR